MCCKYGTKHVTIEYKILKICCISNLKCCTQKWSPQSGPQKVGPTKWAPLCGPHNVGPTFFFCKYEQLRQLRYNVAIGQCDVAIVCYCNIIVDVAVGAKLSYLRTLMQHGKKQLRFYVALAIFWAIAT